jgi:hypothetical protein
MRMTESDALRPSFLPPLPRAASSAALTGSVGIGGGLSTRNHVHVFSPALGSRRLSAQQFRAKEIALP